MNTKIAVLLSLILTFATATVVLAADTTTVSNYEIEFLGSVNNGGSPATSTWTYAVTANGDEAAALSHWVLGLELNSCISIVSPTAAELDTAPWAYVTPTNDPYGYCASAGANCTIGNYEQVEYGLDPATGVTGIKFGDATNNGSELEVTNASAGTMTHIFEIEIAGVDAFARGDVPVGIKAPHGAAGFVTGPICATVTAISLDSLSTGTGSAEWLPFVWLALLTMLVPATYLLLKRQPGAAIV